MHEVAEHFVTIRQRIDAACVAAQREPDSVCLIAVSKRIPLTRVAAACRAGHRIFGENRIQDALPRQAELARALADEGLDPSAVGWHFIGNLQSNKVRKAVGAFSLIHGVDSTSQALRIGSVAQEQGLRQGILLQVNTSGEAQKHGLAPDEAVAAACETAGVAGLDLQGFMTMGRATAGESELRAGFSELRRLAEKARLATGLDLPELSMGMSGDFETAIAEGATMVRIGTALFGPRDGA